MSLPNPRHSGFTLMEVIIVIAVLGVIGSVAFVATNQVSKASRSQKLQSEIATLNSAINVYLSNGGSLASLQDPNDILTKLKTSRSEKEIQRHAGSITGRMIDPRIVAIPVESGKAEPCAIYNPVAQRFEISAQGPGVRFAFDETLNEMAIIAEDRDPGALQYAASDSWVWDYNSSLTNPEAVSGPTGIPVSPDSPESLGNAENPTPPEEDSDLAEEPAANLPAPTFSKSSGLYPKDSFPLQVSIIGQHDPALGDIQYRIGSANWQAYGNQSLSLSPGDHIEARAVSNQPEAWASSSVASAAFDIPTPPRLPTPRLDRLGGAYAASMFPLAVSLTNLPASDTADAVYRIDGGSWLPYSGSLFLSKNSQIEVQYKTRDIDTYRDSNSRTEFYYPVATDLGGSVSASFETPSGGDNLVAQINEGGSFFSHGNPQMDLGGELIDAGEPNTLRFESKPFKEIASGHSFELGNLFYHNGTTFNDSHATSVDLKVRIALANPARDLEFTINLALVNTENSGNPEASADFVRLTNLNQDIDLTIDNVDYNLQLEFGGTDSFGFSSENQFHVYEGATGRGILTGTFVAEP